MEVLMRLESTCDERGRSVRPWSEDGSLALGIAGMEDFPAWVSLGCHG